MFLWSSSSSSSPSPAVELENQQRTLTAHPNTRTVLHQTVQLWNVESSWNRTGRVKQKNTSEANNQEEAETSYTQSALTKDQVLLEASQIPASSDGCRLLLETSCISSTGGSATFLLLSRKRNSITVMKLFVLLWLQLTQSGSRAAVMSASIAVAVGNLHWLMWSFNV